MRVHALVEMTGRAKMTMAMQRKRWKLAILEADEGEANALASRLRDGRLDVHFFEEEDPLPRLLEGAFDLILVRQNRLGPGGLMICNRLDEELGPRRPCNFLLVDHLTDEAIDKHREAKGSVDSYFREWPQPEALTEQALKVLQERRGDEGSLPPAAHQAANDPMEAEAELPEPMSLSQLPEAFLGEDDDELFTGDSDRRVAVLRERLTHQESELVRMRQAWRARETALRKADGNLRQKDVELERLRHDHSRLRHELEAVEEKARSDLDASQDQGGTQKQEIEKLSSELAEAKDRARTERERRDNEIAQLSREVELAEEARGQLASEQRQAREEQRQAAQDLRDETRAAEEALKGRLHDAEVKIGEQKDDLGKRVATIADLNSKIDGLSAQLTDRATELSAGAASRQQIEEQQREQVKVHTAADEAWQKSKEQAAARIAELEAQLRHEQGERSADEGEARVHVESLESQRSALEGSLAERREELIATRTRLETELEKQAAQLGEARQESARLITEMEDRANQSELREERLREETAGLSRRLASAEARIEGLDETLQREREAAHRSASEHQGREQERRDESSGLRMQIEEIQQAHEASAGTLRERLDEAAERSAGAKALEADLRARLRGALEGREQAVQQIERQAEEHLSARLELKAELNSRQTHIEGLEEAVGGRDQTVNELGSTVAGLEVALEQSQNQAGEWRSRATNLEAKSESLLADVERLRGQFDGQGEELAQSKDHGRELEETLQELRTDLTQNEGQRIDLEKQLNFLQSEHQKGEAQSEDLRAQLRALEEELAGREVEADSLRQDLRTAQSERDSLSNERDALMSKADLLTDEKRAQREQLAELEGRYRGIESQLERSRSTVESREEELASSREQGQVLRNELGAARAECETTGRRVDELQTKLVEVSTQRSELGQQLSRSEEATAHAQAFGEGQREQMVELRKQLVSEQARAQGLEDRLQSVQTRCADLESESERARQLDVTLQRQADSHREELGGMQVKLATNQQALNEAEHRADEGQTRIASMHEDLQKLGEEQTQQADQAKDLRGRLRQAEDEARHLRQTLDQYREDRLQLETQFKQFRQAREQLVNDVRGRLDAMHEKLTSKEQELSEAHRRIEDLQRGQAEPARLAKRQAEAHEAEVGRLRERLESAEVKHRGKVAEVATLKEELGASRQDAQSSDRAMRDQLTQVEERLASTARDLQLSQLPQPITDSEEVNELQRKLSSERSRRERLLKESNERLRKAHEVMATMRKTLERLGLVQQEDDEITGLVEPISDVLSEPVAVRPRPTLTRPDIPKPSPSAPVGDPTLMPDVVDAAPLPAQTVLAPQHEFSDDPPPILDED
jgi:chromosome segregation ATPase